MAKRKRWSAGRTGRTDKGNTHDVKVERIGKVTISRRGTVYPSFIQTFLLGELEGFPGDGEHPAQAHPGRFRTGGGRWRESRLKLRTLNLGKLTRTQWLSGKLADTEVLMPKASQR